ncbi:MAG: Holliday junction resolvase RuvX [Synergistaceae bacterium]|jgi:putative Holliday junction resolvase|nr:Holliday junction resolvase RuvX [Synergistaceae bacterium]
MERAEKMERVLALDIGSVRIGVAVTDPLGIFAQGIAVWQVHEGGRRDAWRERFDACLARYDPALVLVGLPIRTNGVRGPEAEHISALTDELRVAYPDRRFELWDERYTTTIAQRALLEGDVSRRKRRERVDKIAAALILQNWLEARAAFGCKITESSCSASFNKR